MVHSQVIALVHTKFKINTIFWHSTFIIEHFVRDSSRRLLEILKVYMFL